MTKRPTINDLLAKAAAEPLSFNPNEGFRPASPDASLFRDLVTPEAVADLERRGLLGILDGYDIPTVREYIDPASFPCYQVVPTTAEIATIEDPVTRANAVYYHVRPPLSDLARDVIKSVAGVWPYGDWAQPMLNDVEPAPLPAKPRKAKPAKKAMLLEMPSLFAPGGLFGPELDATPALAADMDKEAGDDH